MKIKRIHQIWPDELAEFGSEVMNLASLKRLGYEIADGILLGVPKEAMVDVAKKFENLTEETIPKFLQRLEELPIPEQLVEMLPLERRKEIWLSVLSAWSRQLAASIRRLPGQRIEDLVNMLSAHHVVFSGPISASGQVYFDNRRGEVVTDLKVGTLTPAQKKYLNDLVENTRIKFLMAQKFEFIDDGELKITRVKEHQEEQIELEIEEFEVEVPEVKYLATKIYLDNSFDLAKSNLAFGYFVDAGMNDFWRMGNFGDLAKTYDKPLLFKFEKTESVEQSVAEFVTVAKSHLNLSLVIPVVKSVEELNLIKKAVSGAYYPRSIKHKYWLEIGLVENVLNIEKYIDSGIDGLILDLDELYGWVYGFDTSVLERDLELDSVNSLVENLLKSGHKHHIPVLVKGLLLNSKALLKVLIEKGISGVICSSEQLSELTKLISSVEEQLIKSK